PRQSLVLPTGSGSARPIRRSRLFPYRGRGNPETDGVPPDQLDLAPARGQRTTEADGSRGRQRPEYLGDRAKVGTLMGFLDFDRGSIRVIAASYNHARLHQSLDYLSPARSTARPGNRESVSIEGVLPLKMKGLEGETP